jgi:hypothetical protein
VTRDPFYQRILTALAGSLDPTAFEQCAGDLLRHVFPGLTPIPGGNDAGMDGAVPDGHGRPFPLICTTGTDVIGNMQASVRSYKGNARRRRRAVLATSQELTPARRRNLDKAAQRLGFTLVGVYTRSAFADLLYRCPAWCRDLLNLIGDPPPLSALPRSNRPAPAGPLVGRDDDYTTGPR